MTKMVEKEAVVWRQYPEYPFIEVSQFGQIRTKDRYITDKNGKKRLIRGRILKQELNPYRGGYMSVKFNVNGKTIHLYVHRAVAICYISNPDKLPQVNHIDNDPTNNVVSNLEWCTGQYNNDYKKKFGTSPAQVQGKSVFAINLETLEVSRFKSQCEASRKLGISQREIWSVINGKRIQTRGYLFTEDESEVTKERIQKIKSKMRFHGGVIAINLSGFKVFYFNSQSEAASQLNIDISSICAVVHGRLNTTGGFWLCKSDSNTIEKTRNKFGDEIARKVEELMSENCN